MERRSVEAIIRGLNQANVRYLVRMKRHAGRPVDLDAVRVLESLGRPGECEPA